MMAAKRSSPARKRCRKGFVWTEEKLSVQLLPVEQSDQNRSGSNQQGKPPLSEPKQNLQNTGQNIEKITGVPAKVVGIAGREGERDKSTKPGNPDPDTENSQPTAFLKERGSKQASEKNEDASRPKNKMGKQFFLHDTHFLCSAVRRCRDCRPRRSVPSTGVAYTPPVLSLYRRFLPIYYKIIGQKGKDAHESRQVDKGKNLGRKEILPISPCDQTEIAGAISQTVKKRPAPSVPKGIQSRTQPGQGEQSIQKSTAVSANAIY